MSGLTDQNGRHGGPSPEFNWADTFWNNGEGFGTFNGNRADTGGFHGPADGSSLQFTPAPNSPHGDLRTQLNWTLSTNVNGTSYWRFVGALSPNPLVGPATDAVFEVFAPATMISGPTVLVVSLYLTLSTASRITYPGSGQYGLILDGGKVLRPASDGSTLMTSSSGAETKGINIIAAYIVPSIGTRSLIHTLQRNLQLERTVQHMLQTTALIPPSFENAFSAPIAVVANGGSAGGLSSQMLPLLYPNRFHGASSRSFSASLRRTVADQDCYTYISSLLGFGSAGQAYDRADCLQWESFFRQYADIGYYEASFLSLWDKKQVRRPIHFLFSDEDNVTSGNEWASLFSGSYKNAGTAPNPDPNRQHAPVFWSRLDKACHDSMNFVVPAALHQSGAETTESDLTKAVLLMVPTALNSFQTAPTVPSPSFSGFAPQGGDDPYDHALARRETSVRNASRTPTPPPPLLSVDKVWSAAHRGCGTWLGHDDSMIIDGGAVYVGSADGVVSKLTPTGPNGELVVVGQTSGPRIGQTESLGFRAHALAIDGNDLVVATYRRVYKLDKNNLMSSPSAKRNLDWEHSRPGRMQIVDLYADGKKYVVFRSFHGELVILNLGNLSTHISYGEPGIQDFEFGTAPRPNALSGTSVPIYLLSDRGRIIRMEFKGTTPYVCGVSIPSEGWAQDLVAFPSGNGLGLAALYNTTTPPGVPVVADAIKLFTLTDDLAPGNLLFAGQFSDFTNRGAALGGQGQNINDLEFYPDDGVLPDGFLILHGGELRYESLCGTCKYTINLADPSFPAAWYPMAVEVGDIAPGNGVEIVISTESGQMYYFSASELVGQKLIQPIVSDWRVATWGMTFGPDTQKLQCLDQVGRRWEVDRGTAASVHADTMVGVVTGTGAMDKPFMDLAYVGYSPNNIAATALGTDVIPLGSDRWRLGSYFTAPHSNLIGNAANPFLIPPLPWTVPSPDSRVWTSYLQGLLYSKKYMPFSLSGASMRVGATEYSYAWSGIGGPTYRNLIWGTSADTTQAQPIITDSTIWGSSLNLNNVTGSQSNGYADHLRSVSGSVSHNLQSLRLGLWNGESVPRVVVSTPGGSLLVLNPTIKPQNAFGPTSITGELDHQNPGKQDGDHGMGGLALCVHDVRGNGNPTIFFGVIAADPQGKSDEMTSSLMIYERSPALTLQQEIKFDGVLHPKLYGLCGIAIGHLDSNMPTTEHLVLTTLAGDLLIYDLVQASGGGPFAPVSIGSLLGCRFLSGQSGVQGRLIRTCV